MFDKNFINAQQLKAYSAKTIDITQFKRESHLEGMALYFRAELSKYLKIY